MESIESPTDTLDIEASSDRIGASLFGPDTTPDPEPDTAPVETLAATPTETPVLAPTTHDVASGQAVSCPSIA